MYDGFAKAHNAITARNNYELSPYLERLAAFIDDKLKELNRSISCQGEQFSKKMDSCLKNTIKKVESPLVDLIMKSSQNLLNEHEVSGVNNFKFNRSWAY